MTVTKTEKELSLKAKQISDIARIVAPDFVSIVVSFDPETGCVTVGSYLPIPERLLVLKELIKNYEKADSAAKVVNVKAKGANVISIEEVTDGKETKRAGFIN